MSENNEILLNALFNVIPSILDFDEEENNENDEFFSNPKRRAIPKVKLFVEETVSRFIDVDFRQHFRLSKLTFEIVLKKIWNRLVNRNTFGRPTIDPAKQLLAVLWLLATPDSFRSISMQFDVSKSTLFHSFQKVIYALNEISPLVISWPNSNERIQISESLKKFSGIGNVVGAVDGSYVPIKAPNEDPEVYICRKCFFAVTLQVIATNTLKFIDCFCGYPSSVGDHRIFRNSDIYKKIIENPRNYFDEGQFILGDKAYPCLEWCIPPFIERGVVTNEIKNFNTVISSTRQIVERSFALLFGRFRRLRYLDMNRTDLIPCTIMAACVLHNVALLNEDGLDFEKEGEAFIKEQHEDQENESNHLQGNSVPVQRGKKLTAGEIFRNSLMAKLQN